MSDEPTIRLGNIATLEMGQSPPSSVVVEGDGGVPFLQGCAEFGPQYPRPHYSCLKPPKVCRKGDVLISVRAPVGIINKADREYCIGRGLAAVRLSDEFPEGYAWHLLSYWAPGLRRVAQGTTFEAINRDDLANLKVVNIAPEDRSVLVAILDAADQAIAKTETLIAKLKAIKQGLLHDLLTRGLDENGELRDPEKHPEQFKDSPLGRIPKDWEIKTLADLADVERGKFMHRPRNDPRFYGGQYPFVQTGDIAAANGRILLEFSQTLNERGASVSLEFPAGTIAISIAANIADTAVLGQPMHFPDSVVGAVVKPPNVIRYVELCIRDRKRWLDAQAPQSAQKNINLDTLRPLVIPVPSPEEQQRIANVYESQDLRIQVEEAYLSKLKAIKKGLMQDLLTGRVRVNTKRQTREE